MSKLNYAAGFVLLGCCIAAVARGSAQDKVPPAPAGTHDPGVPPKSLGLPETVSPLIGFYQGIDSKSQRIKLAFVEAVAELVTEVRKQNGKEVVVQKTVYKPTAIAGSVPFADIQFLNLKGEKLKRENVVAKLKVGDTLIISGDERPLSAAYLQVLHPDAIIAIFPLDPFIEPFVGAKPAGPLLDPAPPAALPGRPVRPE